MDALGFSRAYGFFFDYAGQAAVVFEEFGNVLNLSKLLTDAALEVVPGGGIEPSTHGFSVRCSTD